MSRWRWPALGLALALSTAAVHAQLSWTPRGLEQEGFVPTPEVAQAFSMGFDSAIADFYWLRAVQVAGDDRTDPSNHSHLLGRLIDVVTTLDPWVDHPYRFAAIWMTLDEDSVRLANELLARGTEHHPHDWRMNFYKGFNHFFYLQEEEQAARELDIASSKPGSPRYLPRLVARLRSQTESLEAATVFLHEMRDRAPDEYSKSEYQAALDEIEIERRARFLERARKAYRELHGRDIEHVADLLVGKHPILTSLPPAEPSSLPTGLRRGAAWEVDRESGKIQSTHYGRRYELSFHPLEEKRKAEWKARREAREKERASEGAPLQKTERRT